MRKEILAILLLFMTSMTYAQVLTFDKAKFQMGDNPEWKNADFDDSSWKTLKTTMKWGEQGPTKTNTYGWYRFKFILPQAMLDNSDLKQTINIYLGKIDDADEAFFNGVRIGGTGSLPDSPQGYKEAFDAEREYSISAKHKAVKWGQENVIAVRVYNGGGDGGMYFRAPKLNVPNKVDGLKITFGETQVKGKDVCKIQFKNIFKFAQKGSLQINMVNPETGKMLSQQQRKLSLKPNGQSAIAVFYNPHNYVRIQCVYTDAKSKKSITRHYAPKYILTPIAPATPRINSAAVMGVRPGSPVIFRIPASGDRPMKFSVKNLPAGLSVNAENGVISGSLKERGEYKLTLVAENSKGKDEKDFSIHVGHQIALTPPMGWNSWNCWGTSVSQEKVMASAKALIDRGLADYGYNYINVDDAWEAEKRNADGTIAVNEKFPNMKGLGDWLHNNGLRFGIYSSPGDLTCGHYLGSLDHEEQDAKTYNEWGVDYLKYDWCGYSRKFDADGDLSVAAYVRPYLKMQEYLRAQPRDIFYSLCQYGMADVWKWGHAVDANSWRTTGDITDTWQSLYYIGFVRQAELYPYAGPGHWNDPDMLVVGKVGWGPKLHDTRLTPDEQYTHISLWTLLAANMLMGGDLSQMDDFTFGLLCNNEVNAINQDALGKQAKRDVLDGDIQIWQRPLADGCHAIGIFNVGTEDARVDLSKYFGQLGIRQLQSVRDLWQQKDLSTTDTNYFVPTHGVKYIKVKY